MDLEYGVPLMSAVIRAGLSVSRKDAFANNRIGIAPDDLAVGRHFDKIANTPSTNQRIAVG